MSASVSSRRGERGVSLLAAVMVVLVLTAVVVYAIELGNGDRRDTGRTVHNASVQAMTESTLQEARGFFANNYVSWNTYLSYFVDHPVQIDTLASATAYAAQLQTDHPELVTTPAGYPGYTCFMYAQDNIDELGPAGNDPRRDNDLLIFVGSVCFLRGVSFGPDGGSDALLAEITAPLLYSPPQSYASQASGGTNANNNLSQTVVYR